MSMFATLSDNVGKNFFQSDTKKSKTLVEILIREGINFNYEAIDCLLFLPQLETSLWLIMMVMILIPRTYR